MRCWICEFEYSGTECPHCGPPQPWGPTPEEVSTNALRDLLPYEPDPETALLYPLPTLLLGAERIERIAAEVLADHFGLDDSERHHERDPEINAQTGFINE